MNVWELPTSLEIGGVGFAIRSDFRAVLDVLKAFNDPDLEDDEKAIVCLKILYEDFDKIPQEKYEGAFQKAVEFIDAGSTSDDSPKPRLMDWEQDAPILIPAVNKVLGTECRVAPYLHWWTFLGAYMEIGEGLFSSVISIRNKKAKGEKLEKYERTFYRENKKLVDFEKRYSEEELQEQERLKALLG